jgi:hypothetical protein
VDRVRKISPSGTITTVAGTGTAGYSGDGGPATQARLSCPIDLALDAAGNLYIADYSNDRIRKVDQSGTIAAVAGSGVWGYMGDGGPATDAAMGKEEKGEEKGPGAITQLWDEGVTKLSLTPFSLSELPGRSHRAPTDATRRGLAPEM